MKKMVVNQWLFTKLVLINISFFIINLTHAQEWTDPRESSNAKNAIQI